MIIICGITAYFLIVLFVFMYVRRKKKDLNGLVCVVTGGAGEIGSSIAVSLLKRGAIVIGWDNDAESIKSAASTPPLQNINFMNVDISKYENVKEAALSVFKLYGKVDVLINNAGISNPFDLEESTEEELDYALRVNFMAHMWTIKCFLPYLRQSTPFRGLKGSVVAISSVLGNIGTGGLQSYCASKAAVNGLMESLYMQYTDIHWLLVTPYLTNTDLFKGMKHRYIDYFYKMLDKHDVAESIVRAMEYQQSSVTIPWFWNYFFTLTKNIFPYWVTRLIEDIFDVRLAYQQHHKRRKSDDI